MKKFLNLVNKIWIVLFLVVMVYQLAVHGSSYYIAKILILLCIIPIVCGPMIIQKLFGYHMSEVLKFFYFSFIMVALICGSVLGWYQKIGWFDLFAHFLSGIVFSIVALIVMELIVGGIIFGYDSLSVPMLIYNFNTKIHIIQTTLLLLGLFHSIAIKIKFFLL